MNILQVKNQRRVIEQAKFTYSPLGKAFEKQTKTIEDQGKMQIKEIEYHGKQIIESNELIKKDFNIDRDGVPLNEQKKYLMNLLKKNLMNLKNKINPSNLIYKYKSEGRNPKDFSNYQNPIDLLIN